MGNGGSSCDAAHVSVEFMHPIIEKRPALPALALTTDTAILTAVGNDQDFSLAFTQQLRMLGKQGDMTLGISTSGKSANVNRALQAGRELGMLMGAIPGLPKVHLHNRVLAYSLGGDEYLAPWYAAAEDRLGAPFILVVEGSIPNEDIKRRGSSARRCTRGATAPATTSRAISPGSTARPSAWCASAAGGRSSTAT